ncbi:MAG: hypothetical protein ACLS43_04260 [Evtepia gabavorous]
MRRLTLRLGEPRRGGPFTPCSGRSFCCPPPVSGGPRPCRTAFCWTGSLCSPTKQDGRDSFSRWRWGTWRERTDSAGSRPLTIRYEDEDLVVVEKEGGVPVHPARGTMGTRWPTFCWPLPGPGLVAAFHPVNRLDREPPASWRWPSTPTPTSGSSTSCGRGAGAHLPGGMPRGAGAPPGLCGPAH